MLEVPWTTSDDANDGVNWMLSEENTGVAVGRASDATDVLVTFPISIRVSNTLPDDEFEVKMMDSVGDAELGSTPTLAREELRWSATELLVGDTESTSVEGEATLEVKRPTCVGEISTRERLDVDSTGRTEELLGTAEEVLSATEEFVESTEEVMAAAKEVVDATEGLGSTTAGLVGVTEELFGGTEDDTGATVGVGVGSTSCSSRQEA